MIGSQNTWITFEDTGRTSNSTQKGPHSKKALCHLFTEPMHFALSWLFSSLLRQHKHPKTIFFHPQMWSQHVHILNEVLVSKRWLNHFVGYSWRKSSAGKSHHHRLAFTQPNPTAQDSVITLGIHWGIPDILLLDFRDVFTQLHKNVCSAATFQHILSSKSNLTAPIFVRIQYFRPWRENIIWACSFNIFLTFSKFNIESYILLSLKKNFFFGVLRTNSQRIYWIIWHLEAKPPDYHYYHSHYFWLPW